MAGKTDIVDALVKEVGLTRSKAAQVLETLFQTLARQLEEGERVQIQGFGSFEVKRRAARLGRNPATGAKIRIPAKRTVRFRASTVGPWRPPKPPPKPASGKKRGAWRPPAPPPGRKRNA